jgi:hypothetical protein
MEASRGVRWPTGAAPIFPFYLFAGGVESIERSIDVDRPLRCELWGRIREHPVRRSSETGLVAPLALRIGGSARRRLIVQQKLAALVILVTLYARARMERAGCEMAPPAPRR